MSKYRRITLSCRVPDDCDDQHLATYVVESLECSGGALHPDDPLFSSISVNEVCIRRTQYRNPEPKDIDK